MVSSKRKTVYPDASTVIAISIEMLVSLEEVSAALPAFLAAPLTRKVSDQISQIQDASDLLGLRSLTKVLQMAVDLSAGLEVGTSTGVDVAGPILVSGLASISRYVANARTGRVGSGSQLFRAYEEMGTQLGFTQLLRKDQLFFPVEMIFDDAPKGYSAKKFFLEIDRYAPEFQQAWQNYISSPSAGSLGAIRKTLVTLESKAPSPEFKLFLSLAVSVIDLQMRSGFSEGPLISEICAAVSSAAARDIKVPEELYSSMLFAIAMQPGVNVRARSLQDVYELSRLADEEFMVSVSDKGLETVRNAVDSARKSWEQSCSTGTDLQVAKTAVFAMASAASSVGDYALKTMSMSMGSLADGLATGKLALSPELSIFGATVLLAIGDRLEALLLAPRGGRQIADYHRDRVRAVLSGSSLSELDGDIPEGDAFAISIVEEIKKDISGVEQIIEQALRDGVKQSKVDLASSTFESIFSALSFINLVKASELSQHVAKHVVAVLQRSLADGLIGDEDRSLMTSSFILLQRYVSLIVADKRQAMHALMDGLALFAAPKLSHSTPSSEGMVGPTDICTDEELGPIFFEEAQDVIRQSIEPGVEALRADPKNATAFADVRRGFHTLKGSARMVELNNLGLIGQHVEHSLNHLRDTPSLVISVEMLDWLSQAARFFSEAIQKLERGEAASADPAPYGIAYQNFVDTGVFGRAPISAIATPGDIVEMEIATLPEVLQDAEVLTPPVLTSDATLDRAEALPAVVEGEGEVDVLVGTTVIPTELFVAFNAEARSFFDILYEKVQSVVSGKSISIDFEVMRMAHSLRGMGRATGLMPIAEVAGAIEQWAKFSQGREVRLSSEEIVILNDGLETLDAMISGVADLIEPLAEPEIVIRLVELVPSQVSAQDGSDAYNKALVSNDSAVRVTHDSDLALEEATADAEIARLDRLDGVGFEAGRVVELESTRVEAERIAEIEAARVEAERIAEIEAARVEAERIAEIEAARVEAERIAEIEAARVEAERIAAIEAARVEAERIAEIEASRVEAERIAEIEASRVEAERIAEIETARVEAERIAEIETARVEAERIAEIEAARVEAERIAEIEAARVEAERIAEIEAARVEAERIAEIEAARVEAERIAEIEAARVEAERIAEIEAARVEAVRIAEIEAARVETARLAEIEAARVEAVRTVEIEIARVEAERIADIEAERVEAERIAAIEAARVEAALIEEIETVRISDMSVADIESANNEVDRITSVDNVLIHDAYVEQIVDESSGAAEMGTIEAHVGGVDWVGIVSNKEDMPDEDMFDFFCEEADERFEEIDSCLSGLAADPADKKMANTLKRAVHTLKGSANTAGARSVGALFHYLEDLMDEVGTLTAPVVVTLQSGVDAGFAAIKAVKKGKSVVEAVSKATSKRVSSVAEHAPSSADHHVVDVVSETSATESTTLGESAAQTGNRETSTVTGDAGKNLRARRPKNKDDEENVLRVPARVLDSMVKTVGEINISRNRAGVSLDACKNALAGVSASVERMSTYLRQIEMEAEKQMSTGNTSALKDKHFDALQMDQFTKLQELTRRVAEAQNDLANQQASAVLYLREIDEAIAGQRVLAMGLSSNLDQIRQVRVSSAVPALKRVVRAAARDTGKNAEIYFDADVEVDRGILNKATGALEHILRNAVAHGIESPSVRLSSGKSEVGTIEFRAYQDGGEVVIEIRDDGAGINSEKVLSRAIERGIVDKNAQLSDDQVRNLLFEPGFSTAESVSDIAGRGVGLDVVRSDISAMGGRVEISSEFGQGTCFVLRVPATLTIIAGAAVSTNGHTYVIPAAFIDKLVRVGAPELEAAYSSRSLSVKDVNGNTVDYELWSLAEVVGAKGDVAKVSSRNSILLMRGERIAVHVDDIRTAAEFVFRPMGDQISPASGLIGSTISSAGHASLVIDPNRVSRQLRVTRKDGTVIPVEVKKTPLVLIVDDSLTVRSATARLLKKHSFRHAMAEDGMFALQKIREERPDVILMDIEMPVMNGYEATEAIRADAAIRDIPIIMITSRVGEVHREMAFGLGVNEYVGKPYNDSDLIALIRKYSDVGTM